MGNFYAFSRGEDETDRIATIIAPVLQVGDVVLLTGELGSGKTRFVSSLAKALGSTDRVHSPSFVIANFHDIKNGSLLHIDVFRLSNIHEFRDLGLEDFYYQSITVIEWGEQVAQEFPCYLWITIEFVELNENHRKFTLSSFGDRWDLDMAKIGSLLAGYQQ